MLIWYYGAVNIWSQRNGITPLPSNAVFLLHSLYDFYAASTVHAP